MNIGSPKRIAVFRALQLGDMLVAVPALRALRKRFPEAEITLIGLPWAAVFARRFVRYVNRFVKFAGYPGIAEAEGDAERTARFLEVQRAYGYDLVLQMHGDGRISNEVALALGGKATVGYFLDEQPEGLTIGAPYPQDIHEIKRNLGLVGLVGCSTEDTRLEFPLLPEDRREGAALLRSLPRANRPWIGIHAGARPPARRWPAKRFARVADELARRTGGQIILTGGPDELETVQAVEKAMKMPAINLAGKTSLGGLGALLGQLDLFVTNDTGPSHIACAVDTPSVTVFGPADPVRWSPLDSERHPIVRHPVPCSPCNFWECPIDHGCLRGIRPERVIEVAVRLLVKEGISCDVSTY